MGTPFDDAIFGKILRLHMFADECQGHHHDPKSAPHRTGASLLLTGHSAARILVASPRMPDGHVRHALLRLQLEHCGAGDEMPLPPQVCCVDFARFGETCTLCEEPGRREYAGDEGLPEWRRQEAHQIICDFSLLDAGRSTVLLYGAASGLKFRLSGEPEAGGRGSPPCVTCDGDVIMSQPVTGG